MARVNSYNRLGLWIPWSRLSSASRPLLLECVVQTRLKACGNEARSPTLYREWFDMDTYILTRTDLLSLVRPNRTSTVSVSGGTTTTTLGFLDYPLNPSLLAAVVLIPKLKIPPISSRKPNWCPLHWSRRLSIEYDKSSNSNKHRREYHHYDRSNPRLYNQQYADRSTLDGLIRLCFQHNIPDIPWSLLQILPLGIPRHKLYIGMLSLVVTRVRYINRSID